MEHNLQYLMASHKKVFYGLITVKTCKVGVPERKITDLSDKVSGKLKL